MSINYRMPALKHSAQLRLHDVSKNSMIDRSSKSHQIRVKCKGYGAEANVKIEELQKNHKKKNPVTL